MEDKFLFVFLIRRMFIRNLFQLPISINERLTKNSSNSEIFDNAKPEYEEALRNSGYENPRLSFTRKSTIKRGRQRKRNIIWFNPPYNKNVSTNVARLFLNLVDKHFTKKNNLHKVFNRNNVKISYSCTENVSSIISSHNKKMSTKKEDDVLTCNCRDKTNCPLDGQCRTQSVIYKCEVTAENLPKKVYIGLTEKEFKLRFNGHKQSFNNEKYKNSTTLSTYVWSLKANNILPSFKWSVVKKAKSYSNTTKSCPLCLQEKLEILCYENKPELLNKRTEIISKCRHINKYILANYKTKD